jgi:hypothetical protein
MQLHRWLPIVTVIVGVLSLIHPANAQTTKPTGTLVITKAVWGDLPDGDKVEVTDKVKALVKENALSVDANNDNFTDPAVGVGKKLKVDYTIDGVAHSKTVGEDETLVISNKPSKLVIVKALYGDLPDGDKSDVTRIVEDHINGDSLKIDASNDNFGDPANGVGKKLQVDYKLNGVFGTITVDEGETLSIPDKK